MQKYIKSYAKALLLLSLGIPAQGAVTKKDFESLSFAAKTAPPPVSKNETQHAGLEDLELPTVPNLVGLDPKDPKVKEEILKGSGFTVVVTGREKSETVPKGAVISQKPKEFSEAKKGGVIRVIISTGN